MRRYGVWKAVIRRESGGEDAQKRFRLIGTSGTALRQGHGKLKEADPESKHREKTLAAWMFRSSPAGRQRTGCILSNSNEGKKASGA